MRNRLIGLAAIALSVGVLISMRSEPKPETAKPETAVSTDPLIGEIMMFAGNFPPRGWALCDGQLLRISENQALFSILGTTYGGDGRVTFGLPDLRGRVPGERARVRRRIPFWIDRIDPILERRRSRVGVLRSGGGSNHQPASSAGPGRHRGRRPRALRPGSARMADQRCRLELTELGRTLGPVVYLTAQSGLQQYQRGLLCPTRGSQHKQPINRRCPPEFALQLCILR